MTVDALGVTVFGVGDAIAVGEDTTPTHKPMIATKVPSARPR
ncbi:MAG TPA: hypothetical protein VFX16_07745 [Pseudonocardiaceae bacterium]|nr:hypothetical protein [Pseudonocardiaceae bacterium]